MKEKILKRDYLIFFVLFILIVILIKFNLIQNIDTFIYEFSQKLSSDKTTIFFKAITFFASPVCLILLLLLMLLFLHSKGIFLLTVMIINQLINEFFKFIIRRPRPQVLTLVTERGFSCPSGHTMGAVIFYGTLLLFIWQTKISLKIKYFLTILTIIFILLIGFSRIYLGVHYFSDILSGLCLSISLLLIIRHLLFDN